MTTGTFPSSGLSYAVLRSGSAVGHCALTIKCGTRCEEGFHSGIAHFTEHTIFRGTARRSATVINGYLDRLGGELNAYTTKEEIVIHATVLKEDLPKAVRLLFELATEATFPETEIQTERGVVIDEIISSKDVPAEDIYDRFEDMLFEGHPLGNPILGTAASVRKISSEELVRFRDRFFVPGRMVLSVVADIPEEKMVKEIGRLDRRLFSAVAPALEETKPRREPPQPRLFDKSIEKRHHEVNAVIGGPAPSLYGGKDRIAAVFLANILGGPASNSLLNAELRERHGWVYGVECSYTQYADTGVIAISFGCDRPNLEKCMRSIGRILSGVAETPLSSRRTASFRKQIIGQMAIASASGEAQCLSMGKSMSAFGKVLSSEETRALLEEVTAEDLRAAAEKLFRPSAISRLVYL